MKVLVFFCGFLIFNITALFAQNHAQDAGLSNWKTIQTVKIGVQIWTAQNLDVDHYRNGDAIPNVQDNEMWRKLKTGAWCYYLNKEGNRFVYGKLYNWYAVNDPRGLAPEGWRLPTHEESQKLISSLDFTSDTVTDAVSFNLLPNGLRSKSGKFIGFGERATFWSSSGDTRSTALGANVDIKFDLNKREIYDKKEGLGVRLVCENSDCIPFSYEAMPPENQTTIKQIEVVKIGGQLWMKKNLEVDHYRNGDTIPQVQDSKKWRRLRTGAWCYNMKMITRSAADRDDLPEVYEPVGKLYNWYAVNDQRGLAPDGWHIPGNKEWQALVDSVGGGQVAGGLMKEPLTTPPWVGENIAATNGTGFSAIPYGLRSDCGTFLWVGSRAAFWTSTESSKHFAYGREIERTADYIRWRHKYYKKHGYSVRCVADSIKNILPDSSIKIMPGGVAVKQPIISVYDKPRISFGFGLGMYANILFNDHAVNTNIWFNQFSLILACQINKTFEIRVMPSITMNHGTIVSDRYVQGIQIGWQKNQINLAAELKFRFYNSKNFRIFLSGGGQYTIAWMNFTQYDQAGFHTNYSRSVTVNANNLFVNTGIGINCYIHTLKIGIELKNSYGLLDIFRNVKEYYPEIQPMRWDMLQLSFLFEKII